MNIVIFRILVLAIVTLTVGSPAAAQNSAVLGKQQLMATADAVRLFKPKDQFDTGPSTPSLSGQAFSVIVSPLPRGIPNKICDGYPSWAYFKEDGRYEVGFFPAQASLTQLTSTFGGAIPRTAGPLGGFAYFTSFDCNRVEDSYYDSTNAFGAHQNVHRTSDVILAFSDVQGSLSTNLWSRLISGDPARALSQSIVIRISGILGQWPDGNTLKCAKQVGRPTFDHPEDANLDACIFKTKSLKFEVLDSLSGEILYQTSQFGPANEPTFGFEIAFNYLPYIVTIKPNSPAERAGLKPGMMISKLNGRPLANMSKSDISNAFKSATGDTVITIMSVSGRFKGGDFHLSKAPIPDE